MISPEDFLEHSNTLYGLSQKNEMVLRNVARNSYYALYHKLAVIDELPSQVRGDFGAHEVLIQQLRKSDIYDLRVWGLKLSNLKSVRTKADYKLNSTFSDFDARKAIKTVESTFSELKVRESADKSKVENQTVESQPVVNNVAIEKSTNTKSGSLLRIIK